MASRLEFSIPSYSAVLLKAFELNGRFVIIWTNDFPMINYLNFKSNIMALTRAYLRWRGRSKTVILKMKSEIRTETSWMDQSATEAKTHFRRTQSFSIHLLENFCEEKVGCRFHQIRVQIKFFFFFQPILSTRFFQWGRTVVNRNQMI